MPTKMCERRRTRITSALIIIFSFILRKFHVIFRCHVTTHAANIIYVSCSAFVAWFFCRSCCIASLWTKLRIRSYSRQSSSKLYHMLPFSWTHDGVAEPRRRSTPCSTIMTQHSVSLTWLPRVFRIHTDCSCQVPT